MTTLEHNAQAVQDALAAAGLDCTVVEFPASTRTAQEAATAIGCSVAQIAKSIVFRTAGSKRAVLVIASGAKRIDPARVESVLGERLEKATPEFVRAATGYAIGGVPPCAHRQPVVVFIDRDLLELDRLWAAAGTPNAVFGLSPGQLIELTGGTVLAVA